VKGEMNMGQKRELQQQTLSVRISDTMREYLERAREVLSNGRGEPASMSQIAKMMLEQARRNPLDDRLEVGELLGNPTGTLCDIRVKWQQQRSLSRAEWIVLARYLEVGCEGTIVDSQLPSRESFLDLVEAFLALLRVRRCEDPGRDQYYLNKLRVCAWAEDRNLGVAEVGEVLESLIQELRKRESPVRPAYVGRTLHVALQEEEFPSVMAINEALRPFLPTFFRLAARGHWLKEQRPVRRAGKPSKVQSYDVRASAFPPLSAGEFQLTTLFTDDGDLAMALNMTSREAVYPLGPFPQIREFAALLEHLPPGGFWKGSEFFGYTDGSDCQPVTRFYFRHRSNGIAFGFSPEEWKELREIFRQVLGSAELLPILTELSMEYGGP
jgi:hypothetical protein